jgi:DNA-binding response OmpR family regulator
MEGYIVDLAVDGGEGLRKLGKARYDLVLLDLMLPDTSAWTCSSRCASTTDKRRSSC